jgi:hypothetical protein
MATHDSEHEAEQRMRQAREAIDEFVAELERRVAPTAGPPPAGAGEGALAGPVVEPARPLEQGPRVRQPEHVEERAREREIAAVAATVESRIGDRVDAKVRAAERRLELQAQALEGALGRDSEVVQGAIAQIQSWREELERAREEAVRSVTGAAEQARTEVATQIAERTLLTVKRAEERLRELGSVFEKQTVEGIVERGEAGVEAAEKRLEEGSNPGSSRPEAGSGSGSSRSSRSWMRP